MSNFTIGSMSYSEDNQTKTAEQRSAEVFEQLKTNAHAEVESMAQRQRYQTALNRVMDCMDRAVQLKDKARTDTDALWAQKQYTTEYLSSEVEKLRKGLCAELRALAEPINEAAHVLQEKVDSERGKLDLKDANFQTALQLIQMGGDALGASTQSEIIAMFSGNAAALKALVPVLEKNELHLAVDLAKREMARLERAAAFPERLTDYAPTLTYSLDNVGGVSEMYVEAEVFAKAYGLNVPERKPNVLKYLMRNAAGLL